MANQNKQKITNSELVEKYDTVMPLLEVMHKDFQSLAAKKPEATLSETKVKMVNRLLQEVHIILQNEPASPFLDMLNDDQLPQNSDVMLVLGQTIAAMKSFYQKYTASDIDELLQRKWKTDS